MPKDAKVRVIFMSAFLRAITRKGLNTGYLLRRVGLPQDSLASPVDWIPLRHYIAMTELIAQESRSATLGLDMGSVFDPDELGPFYMLMMTAGTFGAMLQAFIRFQVYWQTDTCLEMHADGDRVELRYVIRDSDIWPRRQDAEFTLAAITRCIRHALGEQWRPLNVSFEHDISNHGPVMHEFFRCPVAGAHSYNAIVFPRQALAMPLPFNSRSDFARVQPVIERHLIDLMRAGTTEQTGIVDQVRWLVARRVGVQDVQFSAIAAEMGMPERTLRRQLNAHGAGFREMLLKERMKRARRLLDGRAPISLERLAEKLGYSDAAAFSRAFKSWHGISPRRFAHRAR
ncbi:AraC family transcriptional regulator [Paracoccus sp. MKU1]|uniref:AraC family transcriptional regulator n=1 Tax=Paracoccus sp. MKU1 TaxID=1745182 RepID=UPI000B1CCE48|nr:AraC family transcriptional regulator [Paracoccus sp. MKU1]